MERTRDLMRSKYKHGSNREEGLKELEVMSRRGSTGDGDLERERGIAGDSRAREVATGEAQRRRRDEVTAS